MNILHAILFYMFLYHNFIDYFQFSSTNNSPSKMVYWAIIVCINQTKGLLLVCYGYRVKVILKNKFYFNIIP